MENRQLNDIILDYDEANYDQKIKIAFQQQFDSNSIDTTTKLDNVNRFVRIFSISNQSKQFEDHIKQLNSEYDYNEIMEIYNTLKLSLMELAQYKQEKYINCLKRQEDKQLIQEAIEIYKDINQSARIQEVRYTKIQIRKNVKSSTKEQKKETYNRLVDYPEQNKQTEESKIQEEQKIPMQNQNIPLQVQNQEQLKLNQQQIEDDQNIFKLQQMIDLAIYQSKEAQLDKSYLTIVKAKELITTNAGGSESLMEKVFYTKIIIDSQIQRINSEHEEFFKTIEDKYYYMHKNLKELESPDWALDRESKGIKVSYKFHDGCPSVSILMEAKIPVEAIKLMALINETELYYKYVPFCHSTTPIKTITRTMKVAKTEMHFPIIPNREVIFVGEGIDRLDEDGSVILLSKTIDEDLEFQQKYEIEIPKQSKMIRLKIHYYIFQIKPIDAHSCEVRAVTNTDPRISMAPKSILAYVGRKVIKFAFLLFEKIVKYAKTFEKTPWKQKLEENKEFYDWIEEKIEAFLSQKK